MIVERGVDYFAAHARRQRSYCREERLLRHYGFVVLVDIMAVGLVWRRVDYDQGGLKVNERGQKKKKCTATVKLQHWQMEKSRMRSKEGGDGY